MESEEYTILYNLLSDLALKGKSVNKQIQPDVLPHRTEYADEKKIIQTETEEIHLIPCSAIVPRKRGRPCKNKE